MVLGGDAGIPEATADDFRVAGLSHILAVSGQNVLLIVILVQAILMAAVTNLAGALAGTAVAKTVGVGLVKAEFITMPVLLSAMLAAVVWNLLTWYLGLPSSSSHGLIGGLCGA